MKKLLILCVSVGLITNQLSGMFAGYYGNPDNPGKPGPGSKSAPVVKQTIPHEDLKRLLSNSDGSLRMSKEEVSEVEGRMLLMKGEDHLAFRYAFEKQYGQAGLELIRAVDPQKNPDEQEEDVRKNLETLKGVDPDGLLEIKNCADIPTLECGDKVTYLGLLKESVRVSPSGIPDPTNQCEGSVLSALLLYARMKTVIKGKELGDKVGLPEGLGAYQHTVKQPPSFSDLEYLVYHDQLPELTDKCVTKEKIKELCETPEGIQLMECLGEAGVWTPSYLGFDQNGKLWVKAGWQPDNTLKTQVMHPKKLYHNERTFYRGLQAICGDDSPAGKFFAAKYIEVAGKFEALSYK